MNTAPIPEVDPLDCCAGSTQAMAAAIRSHDWSQTVLGPPESWPQSLRSALSICLGSSFQIAIYWGPRLGLLYNDDWAPILGSKHPWALGRPAAEVWPEIWDTIGPLFERVVTTGEPTRSTDQLLAMHRHGFVEECYFDYSFSPVRGEGGKVGGIFNAVVETTFRVIAQRRTELLQTLSEVLARSSTAHEAWRFALQALDGDRHDIPFAVLYMLEPGDPPQVVCAGAAGAVLPPSAAAGRFRLEDDASPWPLRRVLEGGCSSQAC